LSKLYPLHQTLEVMKPSKIDLNKQSHLTKWNEIMKDNSDYIAEEKIDGNHYLSIQGRFFSTHIGDTGIPIEKTAQLIHLNEALNNIPNLGYTILDGEIFYPGWKSNNVTSITGSSPEEAIAKQQRDNKWLYYAVFDILRLPDGRWLLNQPWYVRRKILEDFQHALSTACPRIIVNPFVVNNKQQFLDKILEQGREGIVLKNIKGIYICGKKPQWNWIKYKTEIEDDVIIIGFDPPTREYTGKNLENWPYWENGEPVSKYYAQNLIGAIVMGKYNKKGELIRVGTCSGMTEDERRMFTQNPQVFIGKVAHICAMEITQSGAYRHPSFVRIHPDKNPYECIID